ncbi:MAG TPA: hypothetical protein VGA37_01535 [Gemmatimonadales bacterium]
MGASLLAPLRVPELGPSFGKLITGSGYRPAGVPLDEARLALVTRLMDAAGEARRLADHGERAAALAALGPGVWQDAWEEAVATVTQGVVERVNRRLAAEALAVRMPKRSRADLPFGAAERRGLSGRLGAAGAALVPTLDVLGARATALERARTRGGESLDDWQLALATAARRLEAAWLTLEETIARELMQWDAVADRVARWRRPLWPVWVVGGVLVSFVTWLGLVLGGYAPAPVWLQGLWDLLT